ncbi:hypothetical protein [Desulfolithobacter sp.]
MQLEPFGDLAGFVCWHLLPGMEFGARDFWWSSLSARQGNRRSGRHEGIDLHCYRTVSGDLMFVQPGWLVTAPAAGFVVHCHPDFLAHSLYIMHPEVRWGDRVLYTVYGHVCPQMDSTAGQPVLAGTPVASLPEPVPGSTVPLHLHVTMAWVRQSFAPKKLSWKLLGDPYISRLIDPDPFIRKTPTHFVLPE